MVYGSHVRQYRNGTFITAREVLLGGAGVNIQPGRQQHLYHLAYFLHHLHVALIWDGP